MYSLGPSASFLWYIQHVGRMLLGDGGKLESLADYQRLVTDLYVLLWPDIFLPSPGWSVTSQISPESPLEPDTSDVPAGVRGA
jgi:hypothetical protein